MTVFGANAATTTTKWWQHDKICKLSTTNCYPNMGAGYEPGMWDATGNCWGYKLICPDALTTGEKVATEMDKARIAKGDGISKDFDVNVLGDGCFGVRKTSANGTLATVNGNDVYVWCRGVLSNYDETVATGEIITKSTTPQPTCKSLADDGYVAVVNGRCYGKRFDTRDYYIDCGTELTPSRIYILNGADYIVSTKATQMKQSDATALFEEMYKTSQTQHKEYFKE